MLFVRSPTNEQSDAGVDFQNKRSDDDAPEWPRGKHSNCRNQQHRLGKRIGHVFLLFCRQILFLLLLYLWRSAWKEIGAGNLEEEEKEERRRSRTVGDPSSRSSSTSPSSSFWLSMSWVSGCEKTGNVAGPEPGEAKAAGTAHCGLEQARMET